MDGPSQEFIDAKRTERMKKVDAFDPETRSLIHEYGLNVVQAFINCGVTKPRRIRYLVEVVLDEFSPTRGSYSRQGPRVEVVR